MEAQQFVEEIDQNELIFSEVVGRGAFGVVHHALWRGNSVAVKMIETESERKAFITELKQLSRISHTNIVQLYGACTKQPVFLVMEFAEGGSLYNVLHSAELQLVYTAAHALSWTLQCARGVEYLHGMKPKPLIHRDLKPPNLLLVNRGTMLKICDFGTACDAHTHMTNNKGSAAWMAPEVFEGCNYSEKCDVFSWGIILWEVITRHRPFDEIGGSAFRVMWAVHSGKRPPLIQTCPKPLQTLMTRCWSATPTERPSMSEVVRVMSRISSFFKGENEPLNYPVREEFEVNVQRDGVCITPLSTGQVVGGVDSQNSTVRITMRQQEGILDGDIVHHLRPATPSRKPLVIEDTPSALLAQHEPFSKLQNQIVTDTQAPAEVFRPFVRTHRRAGSYGTPPITVSQKPSFIPGHRRTGSHGNVPAIVTAAHSVLLPSVDPICRMTTAPGNLEDVQNQLGVTNNISNAVRSVSWAPEYAAAGLGWTQKQSEDVVEQSGIQNVMNMIDPQLRPLVPCSSSHQSVEIYNQHLQLLDEYMKLQAELTHLEQCKQRLKNELEVDEKDRLDRNKKMYTQLLGENEQLKLLYENMQKQVEQIHQSNSPPIDHGSWGHQGSR